MKACTFFLIALLSVSGTAYGGDRPEPPCGGAVAPAFPVLGAPPHFRVWTDDEIGADWVPAACTGWPRYDGSLILALAGAFRFTGDADDLLAGFGRISSLAGVSYWSVTEHRWETLIRAASALDSADPQRRRPDFSRAEMTGGRDLFFAQRDNRSARDVAYRLRVLEHGTDRLVISVENVTGGSLLWVPILAPGDIRSVYVLERFGPGQWEYYELGMVREGMVARLRRREASYVNRAAALFRHVAGLPTDAEPPAVP